MRRFIAVVLVAAFAVSSGSAFAQAGERLALVIGNSRYEHTRTLKNPGPDSQAIAKSFEQIGFEVTLKNDLGLAQLRKAIKVFGRKAHGAQIAVIYYAGHGMELGGENWLLPVDARLDRDDEVEDEAISLSYVLRKLRGAQKLKLVILDACRNNPLGSRMKMTSGLTRSVSRGLGRIEPESDGVLVAYAAKHGTRALDGDGQHSPYATALLKHLGTPGLDIRLMFGRVRDDVRKATGRQQEPFVYGSLGGERVALLPKEESVGAGTNQASREKVNNAARTAYLDAKGDLTRLRLFLRHHSKSYYGDLAQQELSSLVTTRIYANDGRYMLGYSGRRVFASEFFREEVQRELINKYGTQKALHSNLSVHTTMNPRMQRMAKKALIDGLVAYDRRHHGWRGPLAYIDDITGDWGTLLVKKAPRPYSDIAPWRQAIVLEISEKKVRIGLRPHRLKSGKLEEKRETGIIPFSEVRWARKLLKVKITKKGKRVESKGKRPKKISNVLAVGDIVYVAPMRPRPRKGKRKALSEADVAGKWRLMQMPKVGGAIVVLDPHTGRVLAMVGGFSYNASNFNRATQAMRQPGSSFIPFVYATALDNGSSPASVVLDEAIAIKLPDGSIWKPIDMEQKPNGPTTLRDGLEHSRILMTVRLAQDMGMPVIVEYARRFGVYDRLSPVLSMSLGAGETTLLRLATGYCIFANGGYQVKASLIDRIQDRYGKTIYRHDERKCPDCTAPGWDNQPEPKLVDNRRQIIDPHTAYQITSMMEGVVKRGTGIRIGRALPSIPLAGMPGRTPNNKNAWFMGFSPDLVVGVFVGYDNPTPMGKSETGEHVAASIFTEFMKMALKGKKAISFRIPPDIRLVHINRKTGAKAMPGSKDAILEAFKPGSHFFPKNFLNGGLY